MIIKIGTPPFPAAQTESSYVAKIEHIWHAARRYAKMHDYEYTSSFGVIGVAPT